jgi:hypothetical protein
VVRRAGGWLFVGAEGSREGVEVLWFRGQRLSYSIISAATVFVLTMSMFVSACAIGPWFLFHERRAKPRVVLLFFAFVLLFPHQIFEDEDII